MILVDFSNLSHRMIFAAIAQGERNGDIPRIKKGEKHKIENIKPFFLHLLFTSLKNIKENFSVKKDEEIILCLDSSSWRKDYYPLYKSSRGTSRDESNIEWKDFYTLVDETIQVITESFPFKVLKVDKAEGDDVIAVLAKEYSNKERTLIITEDKDFKQLLEYKNVQIYRPILKQYIKMNKDELQDWRIEHILLGDKSDSVPSIKDESEFSLDFIKYLESNNIFTRSVYEFNKLSISKKLYSEYKGVDKKGNINIFKAPLFGEKGAIAFVKDGLLQNLKKNKIFRDNFRRNRVLVQFKFIPKDVQQNILESFSLVNETQQGYDYNNMLSFFKINSLNQLASNVDSFCSGVVDTSSLIDEWF